jgi:hypothetical protein
MYRAIISNVQESLPLDLGQITNKGDHLFDSVYHSFLMIAVVTICGMNSPES